MKRAVLGVVFGASLLGWALAAPAVHSGSSPRNSAAVDGSNRLTTIVVDTSDGNHQLAVIDQETQVLAVYLVAPGSGAVRLMSVRNLHWDLQMEHYNGTSPLPGEIRARLAQP